MKLLLLVTVIGIGFAQLCSSTSITTTESCSNYSAPFNSTPSFKEAFEKVKMSPDVNLTAVYNTFSAFHNFVACDSTKLDDITEGVKSSKMDQLWKKETGRAEYVDLFASVQRSALRQMQQTRKNNQKSTEWHSKGNEQFRQENWPEAKICYDKSLCFAEVGTENVVLAYSNRSACFFRALMLANVVQIKYIQEFGRHLIAKCDIPVGKTVLVENDILQVSDEPSVCYSCFRECMNCMACPNCPDAMFCSDNCTNDDQIHKFECGTFFSHLPLPVRFEIKTLLFAVTSFPSVYSLMQFVEGALLENPKALPTTLNDPKSKYHFFFKLSTSAPHDNALTEADMVYKCMMALPKVKSVFDCGRKKHFLMHLAMHNVLTYNTNTFEYDHSNLSPNVSSLMNHSFTPNMITCSLGSNLVAGIGRPIKTGEQLFITYSNELDGMPSNERKTKLKSRRVFDCKCEICEPKRASINREMIISDPCYQYIVKTNIDTNNQTEYAIIRKKCIEFLNKFGRSAWPSEIELVFCVYTKCIINNL